MLTQVDRLEFTVLVDNCPAASAQTARISTLPPGFTLELPQHLARPAPHGPPIDELTGLPRMDFKNYCCGAHGLSLLITTTIGGKKHSVLMDCGPEGLSLERNAKAMKVRLDQVDAIVLSHWHCDHSGGIVKALSLRSSISTSLPPLPVDLHPARPTRRGISAPPAFIPLIALEPDPTFNEIIAAHGKPQLHDEAHEILGLDGEATGVWVSGEIERVYPFEKGLPGAITWMEDGEGGEGWFTDDQIKDERYVVVDVKGKGLVVFSSCSHAGICNVLHSALSHHARPVHMVVGGLHLVPTHQQPVAETVDFLARRLQPTPRYVVPLHCTGLEPRARLMQAMGAAVVPAGVGMRAVVEGSDDEERAFETVMIGVLP